HDKVLSAEGLHRPRRATRSMPAGRCAADRDDADIQRCGVLPLGSCHATKHVMTLDYGRFDALTFDCYGTLIDWEAGILTGLRRVLDRAEVQAGDNEWLDHFRRV